MELFSFWFLFGIISAVIAVVKGRSGCGWFILGSLLGPFGLILTLVVPKKSSGVEKETITRGEMRFRTLFLMFGKLAKTDSHVSQAEIDSIKTVMTHAELDREARKAAIEFFNEGKETRTPFRELAAEFARYAEEVEMRRDTLDCLVLIATADGALHEREERYLNEAVVAFGLPPNALAEALEEILPDMRKYYAILGCDPSVSDDELKRCYREKSLQYHPDRISSKDLAPDFLKFAEEKFKEIQNAYQIVTQHRIRDEQNLRC